MSDESTRTILEHSDFSTYILERLRSHKPKMLQDHCLVYVAGLLGRMIKIETLYPITNTSCLVDRPVAIQLLEAAGEPNRKWRALALQCVGDNCLFLAGSCSENLKKQRLVKIDYFENIGSIAYQSAAEYAGPTQEALVDLAKNFKAATALIQGLRLF